MCENSVKLEKIVVKKHPNKKISSSLAKAINKLDSLQDGQHYETARELAEDTGLNYRTFATYINDFEMQSYKFHWNYNHVWFANRRTIEYLRQKHPHLKQSQ